MKRRAAWLLVAALLGVVWAAAPAAAHTVLVDSVPADGAIVTEAVEVVVLRFNEPVQERFAEVAVTGPDGERVDVDPPTVSGSEVTQAVAALDEHGVYEVRYRVLAADDHPVEGSLRFELQGSHVEADSHAQTDRPAEAAAPPPPAPERRSRLPLAALLAAGLVVATVDGLRRTRVVALPDDVDVVVDVTDVSASRSRR